jgi:hypothetical protein
MGSATNAAARSEWVSDTGELSWGLPAKDRGVVTARTPRSKLVVGHVDGQELDLGHGVKVRVGSTRMGWCTLALTVLEGDGFDRRPVRALLSATGFTENTDMGWKNPEKSTVGNDWGRAPSLVEVVPAVLTLPAAAGKPAVYPLDDRGRRQPALPVKTSADGCTLIEIGPPAQTVWYELDFRPAGL